MPLILGAQSAVATGFNVDNSCRFNSGDSPQLSKSITSTSTTWTFSAWIKRAGFGNYYLLSWGASAWVGMGFGSTDYLQYYETASGSNPVTTAKYRDPSAWYHIVVKNAAGTITFYVNGATPAGSGGTTGHALSSTTLYVGSLPSSNYTNAYMSEVFFIDGTAYSASDFGEFDGDSPTIWKPKDCSGDLTFGTDGFYLDFKDSSNLGNDANGGTDLTETNIVAADQATDTPTNNFCTINPLDNFYQAATFSQGNNHITLPQNATNPYNTSTFHVSAGKWYWETLLKNTGTADTWYQVVGIAGEECTSTTNGLIANLYNWAIYNAGGNIYLRNNNLDVAGWSGVTFIQGDYIGIALDLDNNNLYFHLNGTYMNSGVPTSGATGTGAASITAAASTTFGGYTPGFGQMSNLASQWEANFGGSSPFIISSANQDGNGYGNFEYAVPSGYLALCTKNLGSDGG